MRENLVERHLRDEGDRQVADILGEFFEDLAAAGRTRHAQHRDRGRIPEGLRDVLDRPVGRLEVIEDDRLEAQAVYAAGSVDLFRVAAGEMAYRGDKARIIAAVAVGGDVDGNTQLACLGPAGRSRRVASREEDDGAQDGHVADQHTDALPGRLPRRRPFMCHSIIPEPSRPTLSRAPTKRYPAAPAPSHRPTCPPFSACWRLAVAECLQSATVPRRATPPAGRAVPQGATV